MNDEELQLTLLEKVKKGNCFTDDVRGILINYKKAGGKQSSARKILEDIKTKHPDDAVLQDGADDILDLVVGFCSVEMLVWK